MTILSIDTGDNTKTVLGLDKQIWEYPEQIRVSQHLLPLIENLLGKEKLKLSDLTGIKVNLGPGSFTGLKVGVSVANALAWALKIPVNGVKPPVCPTYEK